VTSRFQFGTASLLKATVWVAVACFIVRLTDGIPIRLGNILYIAAALSFVLAPFAAVGAMFDRMGAGLLCGVIFVVLMAVFLRGF
jgi:hypothetical protein